MTGNNSVLSQGPGAWHNDMANGQNMTGDQARYQRQVTGVSATRTYYLNDVSFDGFKKGTNGRPNTLIEAKDLQNSGRFARAYDSMNAGKFNDIKYLCDKANNILDQARRQVAAANGTNSQIVWRVSGETAAKAINQLFEADKTLKGKIAVEHVARAWTEKEKSEKSAKTETGGKPAEGGATGGGMTGSAGGAGYSASGKDGSESDPNRSRTTDNDSQMNQNPSQSDHVPEKTFVEKAKTLFINGVLYVASAGGVKSVEESKANYDKAKTDKSLPPQGKGTPITNEIVKNTPKASGEILTIAAGAAARSGGTLKGGNAPRVRISTEASKASPKVGAASGNAAPKGTVPSEPKVRIESEPKVRIGSEPKVRIGSEPRVRVSTEPKGNADGNERLLEPEQPQLRQRQMAAPSSRNPSQNTTPPPRPAPRSEPTAGTRPKPTTPTKDSASVPKKTAP